MSVLYVVKYCYKNFYRSFSDLFRKIKNIHTTRNAPPKYDINNFHSDGKKTAILRTKKNDKEKINPLVNDKM